jgi:hypothetical protein
MKFSRFSCSTVGQRSVLLLTSLLTACSGQDAPRADEARATQVTASAAFFDDFSYASAQDGALGANGWSVRADRYGPGVAASWSRRLVSFLDDPERGGNRFMRLRAVTAGTADTTGQAQVYGPLDHLEGTYAARVRFSGAPLTGPGGDQLVQSFYTIADPTLSLGAAYSELDFEYLPNGGWGGRTRPTLYTASWAAYSAAGPQDRQYTALDTPLSGWQTLSVTVLNGQVTFRVGQVVVAVYSGPYSPDSKMRLSFNHWFIATGLAAAGEQREYASDVDWVLQVKDQALTPAQVDQVVQRLRGEARAFQGLGD